MRYLKLFEHDSMRLGPAGAGRLFDTPKIVSRKTGYNEIERTDILPKKTKGECLNMNMNDAFKRRARRSLRNIRTPYLREN
jgi:hypothetical protein